MQVKYLFAKDLLKGCEVSLFSCGFFEVHSLRISRKVRRQKKCLWIQPFRCLSFQGFEDFYQILAKLGVWVFSDRFLGLQIKKKKIKYKKKSQNRLRDRLNLKSSEDIDEKRKSRIKRTYLIKYFNIRMQQSIKKKIN